MIMGFKVNPLIWLYTLLWSYYVIVLILEFIFFKKPFFFKDENFFFLSLHLNIYYPNSRLFKVKQNHFNNILSLKQCQVFFLLGDYFKEHYFKWNCDKMIYDFLNLFWLDIITLSWELIVWCCFRNRQNYF